MNTTRDKSIWLNIGEASKKLGISSYMFNTLSKGFPSTLIGKKHYFHIDTVNEYLARQAEARRQSVSAWK